MAQVSDKITRRKNVFLEYFTPLLLFTMMGIFPSAYGTTGQQKSVTCRPKRQDTPDPRKKRMHPLRVPKRKTKKRSHSLEEQYKTNEEQYAKSIEKINTRIRRLSYQLKTPLRRREYELLIREKTKPTRNIIEAYKEGCRKKEKTKKKLEDYKNYIKLIEAVKKRKTDKRLLEPGTPTAPGPNPTINFRNFAQGLENRNIILENKNLGLKAISL